ncbi:MAG: type I-MYXAN CRISPR-associated endonuclease Cas1 [Planctomycetes bacterium]|nr:type I-MYXAN CRISPR-associated endonuclease Cas1 [Planctomycetota bacterium]
MDDPLLSVAALHALVYCERLFYLEEVERIRVADAAVFAGRRLYEEIAAADEDAVERQSFESAALGIRGAVDVLRRRDGQIIPYEHKRGRSAGKKGRREAWQTDRIQIAAYAMLIEEAVGTTVLEERIRYHADNVTVLVAIDDDLRAQVRTAIGRGRELRETIERPPVTTNERLCVRCSLAAVCLPEESRLGADPEFQPVRLLPPHPRGQVLHVADQGARVGRSGDEVLVEDRDGNATRVPVADLDQIVLHGFAQISTQALRLCADHDVGVQWMTLAGAVVAGTATNAFPAQRHLRQFHALGDSELALQLAKRLVAAKVEGQLRFLLRATRGDGRTPAQRQAVAAMKDALRAIAAVTEPSALLGHEGAAAAAYFRSFDSLLLPSLDGRLRFGGRTKRPPQDRVNTLLGFGYGMLYREVLAAIVSVGLHPGIGFYHRPRSAAHPLALDLMELFRVPIVDMSLVAALNRGTFDAELDFQQAGSGWFLTDSGRRKVIEVIERRRADSWRHDVVGYSLSYARMVELEVRLLEKEWMHEGGLFARFRLR